MYEDELHFQKMSLGKHAAPIKCEVLTIQFGFSRLPEQSKHLQHSMSTCFDLTSKIFDNNNEHFSALSRIS